MKKSIGVLLLPVLVTVQSSHAIIVHGEILAKTLPDGSTHYVYGLGDLYYPCLAANPECAEWLDANHLEEASKKQWELLMSALGALPEDRTKILVEDAFTYGQDTPVMAGAFKTFSDMLCPPLYDILPNIALLLKNGGLPVKNMEFRQKSVACINYYQCLLKRLSLEEWADLADDVTVPQDIADQFISLYMHCCEGGVTVKSLRAEQGAYDPLISEMLTLSHDAIQHIKNCDEDACLPATYMQQMDGISIHMQRWAEKISGSENNVLSFYSYLNDCRSQREAHDMASQYLVLNQQLMEGKIVCEIAQSVKDLDKTFLIGGVTQVWKVFDVLKQMGYQTVYETNVTCDDQAQTSTHEQKEYPAENHARFALFMRDTLTRKPVLDETFFERFANPDRA